MDHVTSIEEDYISGGLKTTIGTVNKHYERGD